MRRLLRRYSDVVYAVLTTVDVLAAAIIVDRLTSSHYIPWGLACSVLLGASVVMHILLYRDSVTVGKGAQNDILGNVLEIAARSLVYPESWEAITIRAYCHRFDRKQRKLHYVTSRASARFDDQFTDIPVDPVDELGRQVFVIAEAVVTGGTVFRELSESRSLAEVEAHVWDDIRFVLACPVHTMDMVRCEASCLGVVSFDTSKAGGDKIDLNGKRARDMILAVADTASLLWS